METLPLSDIYPNPNQPRKDFDEEKLTELAQSIREYGVLEPIVVTPRGDRFMIVGGERRYRASLLADRTHIPVHVIEADDDLVEELSLLENIQRQDLNIIEEAKAFASLIDRGWSKEDLALKMGFKKIWRIDMRLSLLNLDSQFQAMTVKGSLNHNEAYEMSRVSVDKQAVIYRQIAAGKLNTFNKLRAFVEGLIELERQESIFTLQTINEEERESINELESALRAVERFIGTIDKERSRHLKKAVFHSTVTPERLDLIIRHLMRLRKVIHAGSGIKSAAHAA
ncbi:MAG TPA: ParB/RepB/Spo0J family partition protein [Syntrophorhabdaceae bacterium]|nr:ParB/RepB/Spo0J family partition protein [Syntrophorhabdaceae bacterium]